MERIITGEVRLSYVNVWEPKEDNNGNMRYSTAILIPKSDKNTIETIKNGISQAVNAWKEEFGKVPKDLRLPLRDGDETDYPEYADHYFINAKSSQKPAIVNQQVQAVNDQSEIYSGVYARVSLSFYPYNVKGNRGIACGLGNIQKVRDGERLGGAGANAATEFDVIEGAQTPDDSNELERALLGL